MRSEKKKNDRANYIELLTQSPLLWLAVKRPPRTGELNQTLAYTLLQNPKVITVSAAIYSNCVNMAAPKTQRNFIWLRVLAKNAFRQGYCIRTSGTTSFLCKNYATVPIKSERLPAARRLAALSHFGIVQRTIALTNISTFSG